MRGTLVLIVLALSGCSSSRENARAAIQADQSTEAAVALLTAPTFDEQMAELPPEQREAVRRVIQSAIDLLTQARRSLAPVIQRMQVDEPVEVRTTAKQATANPQEFIAEAQAQTGKAWAEVEDARASQAIVSKLISYGSAIANSTLSLGLLGTGGGGLALAIAGAAMKARSAYARMRQGVEDAVAAGNDLSQAVTPKQVDAVKEAHAKRQDANGTRDIIKPLLAKVKTTTARDAAQIT